jgi:FtsZ-interacting cell division protein ZipA
LDFVQDFADQVDASVDIPLSEHVIERAQALDAFCAEVDIQIGINIVADTEKRFAGTKIRALAEASGCVLADDGCFYRVDITTANRLFVLYNLDDQLFRVSDIKTLQTQALGLMMDLPVTADGILVFNQMLLFARQLSQTLHGRLLDVNEQVLTDRMIDKIRRQIVVYQGNMREYGIAPGSPLATRLFR